MNRTVRYAILWSLLVTMMACTGNKTRISGIISGGGGSIITLERLDVNQTAFIDSIEVKKNGSFDEVTKLEEPELFILKNQHGEIINLLLSPGDKISVECTADAFGREYQITGSTESENIRLLVEHLRGTRMQLDSLTSLADSINDPENPQMEPIQRAYVAAIIKQKRYTISYLVDHMGSLSSVYALYQKYNNENLVLNEESDLQYFKSVADSLEKVYPNSSLTKSLRADIDQREARFNEAIHLNELLSRADGVTGILDLSIPDRNNIEISLSGLKGKVILLAFWASGNSASIQALLQLRSTYQKYHQRGFEVYAVSLDNNKLDWMQSVDFNEFNWINVSELSFPGSMADKLYNVTSLPATFLINREQNIVAKNLYGKVLETWLDNLI